jgi:hypothetical protein
LNVFHGIDSVMPNGLGYASVAFGRRGSPENALWRTADKTRCYQGSIDLNKSREFPGWQLQPCGIPDVLSCFIPLLTSLVAQKNKGQDDALKFPTFI